MHIFKRDIHMKMCDFGGEKTNEDTGANKISTRRFLSEEKKGNVDSAEKSQENYVQIQSTSYTGKTESSNLSFV